MKNIKFKEVSNKIKSSEEKCLPIAMAKNQNKACVTSGKIDKIKIKKIDKSLFIFFDIYDDENRVTCVICKNDKSIINYLEENKTYKIECISQKCNEDFAEIYDEDNLNNQVIFLVKAIEKCDDISNITEMLNKKNDISLISRDLLNLSFFIPFNNNSLVLLSPNENTNYIPLFTSFDDLKDIKYNRLDKVTLEIVIRDIYFISGVTGITINPFTNDYVLDTEKINYIKSTYEVNIYKEKNIISIYGHPNSGKSSLAYFMANCPNKKCALIDLEGNYHFEHNQKLLIYKDEIGNFDRNFFKHCIDKNDIIIIDYIDLLKLDNDDIENIALYSREKNKKLVLVSCCNSKNKLTETEKYEFLNRISDLVILLGE